MTKSLLEFKETREQLANVFHDLSKLAGDMSADASQIRLQDWGSKIRDNRFRLLVVGDFKRGKSTLLNALLGARIAPSAMRPCTGGITVIRDGSPPRAQINYWPDEQTGRTPPPEDISLESFRERIVIQTADRLPGEAESDSARRALRDTSFRDITVHLDSKLCRDGVELVDSPGLNEDKQRTELTHSYIPTADAGIFVLSAQQLLSENELQNIESFRRMGLREFFFVVNFWDQVEHADDPEREARELRLRAERLLAKIVPNNCRIHYVSAFEALKLKEKGETDTLKKTPFAIFEKELMVFLTRERANIQLERYRSALDLEQTQLRDLLEQRKGLVAKSINELEIISRDAQQKYDLLNTRIRALTETISAQGKLSAERLRGSLQQQIQMMIATLPAESENWNSEHNPNDGLQAMGEDYLQCAQAFVRINMEAWTESEANVELDKSWGEILPKIQREFEIIRTDIQAITQDPSNQQAITSTEPAAVGVDSFMSTPTGNETIQFSGVEDGVLNRAARTPIAVLATVAGAVASLAIFPVAAPFAIGLALFGGGLAGGILAQLPFVVAGNEAKRRKVRETIVNRTLELLQKQYETAGEQCQKAVNAYFDVRANSIESMLAGMVKASESQLREVLEQKKSKSTEIVAEQEKIKHLRETLDKAFERSRGLIHGYIGG